MPYEIMRCVTREHVAFVDTIEEAKDRCGKHNFLHPGEQDAWLFFEKVDKK